MGGHIGNIYQCNIYWENKTEEEKISEEAAQGGHALKKADQWLKDAQNANLENLSPEEVNKTVQSILSFFSPLNNNNSKTEVNTTAHHNRNFNRFYRTFITANLLMNW